MRNNVLTGVEKDTREKNGKGAAGLYAEKVIEGGK